MELFDLHRIPCRVYHLFLFLLFAKQIGNFEKSVQNLKVQLSSAQGSHKEAINQVTMPRSANLHNYKHPGTGDAYQSANRGGPSMNKSEG